MPSVFRLPVTFLDRSGLFGNHQGGKTGGRTLGRRNRYFLHRAGVGGASVEIYDCDGPYVASHCKSTAYLTETSTISAELIHGWGRSDDAHPGSSSNSHAPAVVRGEG